MPYSKIKNIKPNVYNRLRMARYLLIYYPSTKDNNMQSNIIFNHPRPNATNSNLKESAGIFMEMEMHGIDPAPFLEIAARDLVNQYGKVALSYSARIAQDFQDEGDIDSAIIWSKISSHLSTMKDTGNLLAH